MFWPLVKSWEVSTEKISLRDAGFGKALAFGRVAGENCLFIDSAMKKTLFFLFLYFFLTVHAMAMNSLRLGIEESILLGREENSRKKKRLRL